MAAIPRRTQTVALTEAMQREALDFFLFLRVTAAHGGHVSGAGNIIGERDLMIAATALVQKLTVVTRNTDEFPRTDELTVEDWQE